MSKINIKNLLTLECYCGTISFVVLFLDLWQWKLYILFLVGFHIHSKTEHWKLNNCEKPQPKQQKARKQERAKNLTWEFDPGSGWTLAACLIHASRADGALRGFISGGRVSNAWITCLSLADTGEKSSLIRDTVLFSHGSGKKDSSVEDGSASD